MSSQLIILGPYVSSELVLIKAVSNLHPGVGRAGEIVDLPVQRDSLGFPIIYSSSLKGALKSTLWHLCSSPGSNKEQQCVNTVKKLFGSEPEDLEKFTSSIAVLDAIIITFPVRSLEGTYAYVSSPLLLKRLMSYVAISGGEVKYNRLVETLNKLLKESENKECVASQKAVDALGIKNFDNNIIINEELILKCHNNNSINIIEEKLQIESNRLLILDDDLAKEALERSLVRVTRIALNREKKTVMRGALWTEEYIPIDTVFATVFLYSKTKKTEAHGQQNEPQEELRKSLEKTGYYLIIGGRETIGRGIVKLIPLKGDENEQGKSCEKSHQ